MINGRKREVLTKIKELGPLTENSMRGWFNHKPLPNWLSELETEGFVWREPIGKGFQLGRARPYHLTHMGILELVPDWDSLSSAQKEKEVPNSANYRDLGLDQPRTAHTTVGRPVREATGSPSISGDTYNVSGVNRVVNAHRYYEMRAEIPHVDKGFEIALAALSPSYTFDPKTPNGVRVIQALQRENEETCRTLGHDENHSGEWCKRCGARLA